MSVNTVGKSEPENFIVLLLKTVYHYCRSSVNLMSLFNNLLIRHLITHRIFKTSFYSIKLPTCYQAKNSFQFFKNWEEANDPFMTRNK